MSTKTAIITGASRGIGAAIARGLANDGIAVAINYRDDSVSAENVVKDIVSGGGRAVAIQANVADRESIDSLFAQTERAFVAIDIVVNNAGLAVRKPFGEFSEQDFDAVIATNLKRSMGTAASPRVAAPALRKVRRFIGRLYHSCREMLCVSRQEPIT